MFPLAVYRNCRIETSRAIRNCCERLLGRVVGRIRTSSESRSSRRNGLIQRSLLDDGARWILGGDVSFVHLRSPSRWRFGRCRRYSQFEHRVSYSPSSTRHLVSLTLIVRFRSTAAVIAARRLSSVRDLIQHTSLARTLEGPLLLPRLVLVRRLLTPLILQRTDFATSAMKALAKNPYDIPFAILYHVEDIVTKPTTREVRAGLTTSQRKTIKLSCKVSRSSSSPRWKKSILTVLVFE